MSLQSRCMAGLLLVLLPTVVFGGASILTLLTNDPASVTGEVASGCNLVLFTTENTESTEFLFVSSTP